MSTWRLRTSLYLLLVAATALTFTLIGCVIFVSRLPQINADAQLNVQESAADQARLLEFYLAGIEAELRPVARLAPHQPAASLHPLMQALAGEGEQFIGLYLADGSGLIRAAVVPGMPQKAVAALIGTDLSRSELFRNFGDRSVLWSDKHLSVASGAVVIGVGIRSGEWTAIAEISPALLRDTVATISGSGRDRILVVDRVGEWIADNTGTSGRQENLGADPLVRSALLAQGAGRTVDAADGSYFVGSAQPNNLGWTFVVSRPAGFANPEVRRVALTILAGFVAALAIGLLIAPLWARQLARPVQRLITRTHLLARGRYEDEAELRQSSRISELNALDENLQAMTDAIRQRERELADSEERLRATIENSPAVAVQWFDRDGVCRYWNPASTQLYGFDVQEMLGRTLAGTLFSQQQHDDFVDILRQVDETGEAFPTIEFSLRHKDGSQRIVLCSIFAIPDGNGGRQYVCLDVDISERKRAESALQARELELESIFNASPAPMTVSRVDNFRIEKVNEAWIRQFGWSAEEVIGRTGADLDLYADPEERLLFIRRFRYGPGTYDDMELWLKRADGSQLLCNTSARLIEVAGQRLLLMVCVDITDERRMATELRHINEELETRVEQRTALLSEANSELASTLDHLQQAQAQIVRSEKLAALGRLVAGVAHELNTPIGNGLMAVSTLEAHEQEFREAIAGSLKRSTLEQFVDNVATATGIATRNLQRAAELVAGFKQVAADQASSQRRKFNLKTVVEEVLLTLLPTLSRGGHQIEKELPEDIVLDSYPGPLGQVLTNLIDNAVRHAFIDGGGHVRIAARAVDGMVSLTVADDGQGIPEAHLGRVFDPFFTTQLGQGGSGLGLHIVHNIVEATLGGRIEVSSSAGQGTTFALTLPTHAPSGDVSI